MTPERLLEIQAANKTLKAIGCITVLDLERPGIADALDTALRGLDEVLAERSEREKLPEKECGCEIRWRETDSSSLSWSDYPVIDNSKCCAAKVGERIAQLEAEVADSKKEIANQVVHNLQYLRAMVDDPCPSMTMPELAKSIIEHIDQQIAEQPQIWQEMRLESKYTREVKKLQAELADREAELDNSQEAAGERCAVEEVNASLHSELEAAKKLLYDNAMTCTRLRAELAQMTAERDELLEDEKLGVLSVNDLVEKYEGTVGELRDELAAARQETHIAKLNLVAPHIKSQLERYETRLKELEEALSTAKREGETALRQALFDGHGCALKYGDDGERQCGRLPMIDFQRDSITDIRLKSMIHGQKRLDEARSSEPLPSQVTSESEQP